jgi:long-chain acyl-CoA synthetase
MIPFLEGADAASPCLRDDQTADWVSYGQLTEMALSWSSRLVAEKDLVFLYAPNDLASVAALLGAMAAGHAVALLDPKLPEASKQQLREAYNPRFEIDFAAPDQLAVGSHGQVPPHPSLALLLSTSGSTGSRKFVRLTLDNVRSNAVAIAGALAIQSGSVASGHLPLHYSFGLSILTSHLCAGARIALTERGFMERDFWTAMKDAEATHLPGVPFHFAILERLGYDRIDLPQLESLTQAGGHLDIASRERAHAFMEQSGGRFYVMYGQTEGSPRLTTLQHHDFPRAPASVGRALAGGSLEIDAPDAEGRGEVVYRGPNVMMGYAEQRSDLAKGDELAGLLHTGDLGFLDDAARLTLTGRAKRSAKVYGLRVNLDEVEKLTNSLCRSAVIQSGSNLRIFYEEGTGSNADDLRQLLLSRFSLPPGGFTFRALQSLPRTERGKIDYEGLGQMQ